MQQQYQQISLGLYLILYVFYAPRVLGFLVSVLVRWLVCPRNTYFEVGSISLAPISGRIFFRSLRIYTLDYGLRVVGSEMTSAARLDRLSFRFVSFHVCSHCMSLNGKLQTGM